MAVGIMGGLNGGSGMERFGSLHKQQQQPLKGSCVASAKRLSVFSVFSFSKNKGTFRFDSKAATRER